MRNEAAQVFARSYIFPAALATFTLPVAWGSTARVVDSFLLCFVGMNSFSGPDDVRVRKMLFAASSPLRSASQTHSTLHSPPETYLDTWIEDRVIELENHGMPLMSTFPPFRLYIALALSHIPFYRRTRLWQTHTTPNFHPESQCDNRSDQSGTIAHLHVYMY